MLWSRATSQRTATRGSLRPPVAVRGVGARRVQITKPSADGSPLATPSLKGSTENDGVAAGACARAT